MSLPNSSVELGPPIAVPQASPSGDSPTPTVVPDEYSPSKKAKDLTPEEAPSRSLEDVDHPTPLYHASGPELKRPKPVQRQSTRATIQSYMSHPRRPETPDSDTDSIARARTRQSERSMPGAWSLEKIMKENQRRDERDGRKARRLDVAWKDLCVRGVGADAVFADDLGTMLNPMTARNDKKRKEHLTNLDLETDTSSAPSSQQPNSYTEKSQQRVQTLPKLDDKLGKNEKYLIQGFNGVLKSGEMALVLGRPGAGCTTFMKSITNIKQGYAGIDGDISYGTLDSKQAERYPGQIVFVDENEVFYPDLTVDETIKFALKMKTPSSSARPEGMSREEYEEKYRDMLLKTFGIEHTVDTKVGNESVRGVSGGERKRVTLAEALVTRAPVIAFDQPTRGLDASTALEFGRSLRTITDYTKTTSFTTAYQAGNAFTECFDKVLVIASGRCIYWGPMNRAQKYFEDMGFEISPGANLSDYLTAVTVATERKIKEGMKGEVPNTAEDFALAYLNSDICAEMLKEQEDYLADQKLRGERTAEFEESVKIEKAKRAGKKGPYTTSLTTQVGSAVVRQFALTWNDRASLYIKLGGCIIQSVVLGSVFYMLPETTNGLFGKSGVLFLILLANALLGLGEVVNSFKGRTILAKHKSMALYRPSALILAQVVVDLPIVALQVTVFILPLYWMSGLKGTAGAFFTLWILTYVTTNSLLGFFRMIGYSFASQDGAGAVSGLALGLLIITMGYIKINSELSDVPWIAWVRWLNPLYYALESAFINEFKGTTIPCAPPDLIPYGQGYPTSGNGITCTVTGAGAGQNYVDGTTYLEQNYGYRMNHLWRNFGIVIVWWIGYLMVTIFAVERLKAAGSTKSFLLFRRPAKDAPAPGAGTEKSRGKDTEVKIDKSDTIFAWKGLSYTVKVKGGKRKLLNDVQGYTKPGSLVALMGSSGAGKTTLLDVLGARKEDGVIEGEITVDGRPLGPSFQRTCGYVGQMDVHDPTQTIREAFVFSARLRQPRETPEEEIQSYVNSVIDVLELEELADAVIGVPGAGLSIEQRKRTTIGVELVARPSLLFLDEPTSGLDGQSAYQILRFLKKLAAAGQSMLVTVHQPSALLFEQFDQLLLLAKGGRTVYNGPLGKNASALKEYFEKNGEEIDDDANPAEAMIDIVSGYRSKGKDWAQVWLDSEEYQTVTKTVNQVTEEARNKPPSFKEDGLYYAATLGTQIRLVMARAFSNVNRSPDYIFGIVGLCIGSGLVTGLTFLRLGHDNSVASVQNRVFAAFNAMFVAPGLFNMIQARVIAQRTLYESREKSAKMFGWFPWVLAIIVCEIPNMLLACILNWTAWYLPTFAVSQNTDPSHGGAFFALDVFYFFWISGFAIFVGLLCPTPEAAALLNSVPLALMATFAGVLLPYPQIPSWWRYWLYYLDPWSYILGGKVFFALRDIPIRCNDEEFAVLQAPDGQTCGEYLSNFLSSASGYVQDPSATGSCSYCKYSNGNEYLASIDITDSYIGWRNYGITALWAFAFWGFCIAAFAWRSRKS